MVAVIRCRLDEIERLKFNMQLGTRLGNDAALEISRPRDVWTTGGGLSLVLDRQTDDGRIAYLGWTSILRHAGDLDRVVEVSRLEPVEPSVAYKHVLDRLTNRQSHYLKSEGPQTPGTGEALVAALLKLRPGLRDALDEIKGVSQRYPITRSTAGQVLAMQRDASIAAVRMAGMIGASHFSRWNRPPTPLVDSEVPPTYLEGVPEDTDEDSQEDTGEPGG
jgi:hypothetical protein